jgi:hypothetical protein
MISVNNNHQRPASLPVTADMDTAYVRLVLGVAHHVPGLLNSYWGPPAWQQAITADPPSLETLRTHAVAVATAANHIQRAGADAA